MVVYEGLHTYGGMAGRDMEAVAIGLRESVDDDHIRARIGQVEYLGPSCSSAGVPIVGRSAATACSRRPGLPAAPGPGRYPAQALAAELYVEGGVRTMERGNVCAGRDSATGHNRDPGSSSCGSPSRAASTRRPTWT